MQYNRDIAQRTSHSTHAATPATAHLAHEFLEHRHNLKVHIATKIITAL